MNNESLNIGADHYLSLKTRTVFPLKIPLIVVLINQSLHKTKLSM